MPDTKVSALPVGMIVANAQVLPCVQAGVLNKVTKQNLRDAAPGEDIIWVGAAGRTIVARFTSLNAYHQFDDAGNNFVHGVNGVGIGNMAAGYNLQFFPTGAFALVCQGMGTGFVGTVGGPSMTTNPLAGGTVVFVAGGGMVCPYIAAAPLQWNIAPPPDYNTAINRLAAAVFGLLGAPIP